MSNTIPLEPEFYPIDRILICGPAADCIPLADRAAAAGHTPTLMLPADEVEAARESCGHRILDEGEAIGHDDFDLAVELFCVDLEAKAETLFFLEDALNEQVPILTLTIAITTGELSRDMLIPERVLGISLLPPIVDSKLVELMPSLHTADDVLQTAERFCESIDWKSVRVADSPGGVLVRTVCCLVNEAALALQQGVAPQEDLDTAMEYGAAYPNGPMAWGDRIGLDRVEAVMDGLHAWFREERYRTTPLLKRLVRAGFTGLSAGHSFFAYDQ